RTGGSPAATPSRSTSVCVVRALARTHNTHTCTIGNALLLNKIDTASNANSFKRTWIVIGHLSLHIPKERLPTTICKADGVPQFPSIPGIVDICSSNDLEVVTIRCAIDGVEGTWVVGLLSIYISKERLPTTICKADGVPQLSTNIGT